MLLRFLIVVWLVQSCSGAKILFLIGLGSHSHRVAVQPLATGLADRGHDITFVSARQSESVHPKIKEMTFEGPFKAVIDGNNEISMASVEQRLESRYTEYLLMGNNTWNLFYGSNAAFLKDKNFIKFIGETGFDLIVGDFVIKETATVMAYLQQAKLIWFNSAGVQFMADLELLGIPSESSWLPDFTLGSSLSFIPDHFVYNYNAIWWYFSFYWHFLPLWSELVRNNLGAGIPTLDELITSRLDLVLVNEHFSFAYPRSLPPFVIPVGGMHCKDSNGTLPKDVEDFIAATDTFVYISFGSIINVTRLPLEMQQLLFESVASFPNVRFLWKWEDNVPDNLPKNVLTRKWFPQQDVLAHSKCKGFVTQGGAMSFQQAIYHGVPMVVVPVWWDQPYIARSAVEHGVGVHLELSEITGNSFRTALADILYNKSYLATSKLVAKRFKERPMSPVDTAVWWVEYVLRHDTGHLKSPAMKQRWWQRRLLEFWLLIFIFTIIVVVVLCKILVLLFRILTRKLSSGNQRKVKRS